MMRFASALLALLLLLTSITPMEMGAGDEGSHPISPLAIGDENATVMGDYDHYYSYEELVAFMGELVDNHSEIARLQSLGKTYHDRDLWAIKISDNPGEEEACEPDVLVFGGIHAREWPSYMVPLYYADVLLSSYGNDTKLSWLIDNREIWIVPLTNPDGTAYMQEEDYDFRKNLRENDGDASTILDNEFGVDLNRNFGWHWMEVPADPGDGFGSSPARRSGNYAGPPELDDDDGDGQMDEDNMDGVDNDGDGEIDEDPRGGFSEPETQALRGLTDSHSFVTSVSYHTHGEWIIYPWGYTDEPCEHDALFVYLANEMAAMNGYQPVRGFEFYKTSGDSDDFLYGAHGTLTVTLELCTEFRPPEDEIIDVCQLNLPVNIYMTEIADVAEAARDLGLPNLDLERPGINYTQTKKRVDEGEPYTFRFKLDNPDLVNASQDGVYNISIMYSIDGGDYVASDVPVENVGGSSFEATIPGQRDGSRVSYYIVVNDVHSVAEFSPEYAPYYDYSYKVEGKAMGSWGALAAVVFIAAAIGFVAYRRLGDKRKSDNESAK